MPAQTVDSNRDHGYARYKLDGCRCYTCSWAVSQYNAARDRAMAYGTWQPFVNADPVRQHLKNLQACGLGLRRIADAARTDRKRLQAILTGRPERGTGPQQQVRPELAEAILSVQPTIELLGPATPVASIGTHRRLQALIFAGWPQHHLAVALDMTDGNFGALLDRPQVLARTALAVRGLYDKLWRQDPRENGVGKQAYSRSRNHAAARGWAPVGAWDDDTIDDPAAEPDFGGKQSRAEALAEDALWLIERHGYTRQTAAERLGVTRHAVDQAISRAQPDKKITAQRVKTPPKCGEARMYRIHLARGENCYECRGANAAADRRYRLTGTRKTAA
jgi:hypothetical protein